MNVLMGQIGIDYSKLTKEEQMTLLRVFNKSSMLKHRTKAGMRGESTGADPFALCFIGETLLRKRTPLVPPVQSSGKPLSRSHSMGVKVYENIERLH